MIHNSVIDVTLSYSYYGTIQDGDTVIIPASTPLIKYINIFVKSGFLPHLRTSIPTDRYIQNGNSEGIIVPFPNREDI